MITTPIQVAEEAYDRFHKRGTERRKSASTMISQHVQQTAAIDVTQRFVVLQGSSLETLEGILQGGSILNSEDCLAKVERLAGISFAHIRLGFTPGQLEQLQEKARRQGKTVDRLVQEASGRICEQFFGLLTAERS